MVADGSVSTQTPSSHFYLQEIRAFSFEIQITSPYSQTLEQKNNWKEQFCSFHMTIFNKHSFTQYFSDLKLPEAKVSIVYAETIKLQIIKRTRNTTTTLVPLMLKNLNNTG